MINQLEQSKTRPKAVEPFIPREEIERIRALPKGTQRTREFEKFKESLLRWQEALAQLHVRIVDILRKNPDTNPRLLRILINDAKRRIGFHFDMENLIYIALDRYYKRRGVIKRLLAKSSNASEIFQKVFGVLPEADVQVIAGAVSLCFACDSLNDYAVVYNGRGELSDNDIAKAERTGGVNVRYDPPGYGIGNLQGGITAIKGVDNFQITSRQPKNDRDIYYDPMRDSTDIGSEEIQRIIKKWGYSVFVHEDQHAMHDIFYDYSVPRAFFTERKFKESTKDQKIRMLRILLRQVRLGAEVMAKDEILAFTREKEDQDTVIQHLLKKSSEGGLYDYIKDILWELKSELGVLWYWSEEDRTLFFDEVKHIFEDEYSSLIRRAVEAIQEMSDLPEMGERKAIRLFEHQPLRIWPKILARFKKSKLIYGEDESIETTSDQDIEDEYEYDFLPKRESHRHPKS